MFIAGLKLQTNNQSQELLQLKSPKVVKQTAKRIVIKHNPTIQGNSNTPRADNYIEGFKYPQEETNNPQRQGLSSFRQKLLRPKEDNQENQNGEQYHHRVKTDQNEIQVDTQKEIQTFLEQFQEELLQELPKFVQKYQSTPQQIKEQFKQEENRLKEEKQKKCEKLEKLKKEYEQFIKSSHYLTEQEFRRINNEKLDEIQDLQKYRNKLDELLFQSQKTLTNIDQYIPRQLQLLKELDKGSNSLYERIRQSYPKFLLFEK